MRYLPDKNNCNDGYYGDANTNNNSCFTAFHVFRSYEVVEIRTLTLLKYTIQA